jgi:hypothetical protein
VAVQSKLCALRVRFFLRQRCTCDRTTPGYLKPSDLDLLSGTNEFSGETLSTNSLQFRGTLLPVPRQLLRVNSRLIGPDLSTLCHYVLSACSLCIVSTLLPASLF